MPLFSRAKKEEDPTEETTEETTTETPSYVTTSDLSDLRSEVQNGFLQMQQNILAPQTPAPTEEKEPTIEDVSDTEYESALSSLSDQDYEGDRSQLIRTIRKREDAKQTRLTHQINTQFAALKRENDENLGRVGTHLAESSLERQPYYQLFKRDIDEAISNLPAATRLDNNARLMIYNNFVGANVARVMEYDTDLKARKAAEQHTLDTAPGRTPAEQKDKTSFSSAFGSEFAEVNATIPGVGPVWNPSSRSHQSPDDFARSKQAHGGDSFESADDYARYATAIMSIERCNKCLQDIINQACMCEAIAKHSSNSSTLYIEY